MGVPANVRDGPRVSVNGICTNRLTLHEDLAFWERHGIVDVGIPLRKLGSGDARRVADAGLRVSNLLAWGPPLDDRSSWPEYRERIESAFEQAAEMRSEALVVTTGPAGSLSWEEAALTWCELSEELFAHAPSACCSSTRTSFVTTSVSSIPCATPSTWSGPSGSEWSWK